MENTFNHLSKETSPYLLQHKDNPVNWFAWNDEAWDKARSEGKMVLVSIGYSACHWCHVMEHEVFEDFESAEFMNAHFVCVKVDREERPDVDSVYMDAVHLMGGQGGWPLNVFTLPDGRPVYGGTYFPKTQWLNVLENLVDLFKTEPGKILEYADRLQEGMTQLDSFEVNLDPLPFDIAFVDQVVENWSSHWDMKLGGSRRSPKFPMPNNLEFLLQYSVLRKDAQAAEYVAITLEKMALGGIYDQVAGGFSRYSVDEKWKVPHFEKMLYDNAQLVSVYAKAFLQSQNPLYRNVITQTLCWAETEMLSEDGLFYSALDADSEGIEGKFYTWSEAELQVLLKSDFSFAKNYFSIGEEGFWEHDQNILLRNETDEIFASAEQMSLADIKLVTNRIRRTLLDERKNRIRPGLDDKCITSWNAMLVTAYVDAYKSLGDIQYLVIAERTAQHLLGKMRRSDGALYHIYIKGKVSIDGFLDDYAFMASCLIDLYEANGGEEYLRQAKSLADKVMELFFHSESGLFYFTSSGSEKLVSRKKEIHDNVMPSSNSVMAKVLFVLGRHFEDSKYQKVSEQMMRNVLPLIDYGSGYSNWLQLYLWNALPFREVVITGDHADTMRKEMMGSYLPNTLFAASTSESELPLFKGRMGINPAIYVCTAKTCAAPVQTITEAFVLLK